MKILKSFRHQLSDILLIFDIQQNVFFLGSCLKLNLFQINLTITYALSRRYLLLLNMIFLLINLAILKFLITILKTTRIFPNLTFYLILVTLLIIIRLKPLYFKTFYFWFNLYLYLLFLYLLHC